MVKHLIKVKHVYQDLFNPAVQEIIIDGEYGIACALFATLIDKGKDFTIEVAKSDE